VSEDDSQLFQFQGWGDAEHASLAIKTTVRDENVIVGIESEEVAEGLYGDDGARDWIILRRSWAFKGDRESIAISLSP
jgi:hypothetical protein